MPIQPFVSALDVIIQLVIVLIIVRAVMSFFPQVDPHHPLLRTIDQIIHPIMAPFQRLMPPVGGIDLSPILAITTLQLLERLLILLIGSASQAL
jgi:YggT family protein